MLRAQGLIIGRDEIGRDLREMRTGSDPKAVRLARWGIRRLAGQADLASFLGLHRQADADACPALGFDLRPRGWAFDAAAADFPQAADGLSALHPLVRTKAAG